MPRRRRELVAKVSRHPVQSRTSHVRTLAYLPTRLNSRYKRVKFVRRTHGYLSLAPPRFVINVTIPRKENARAHIRTHKLKYTHMHVAAIERYTNTEYVGTAAQKKNAQSRAAVSSVPYLAKLSRWGGDCARFIYVRVTSRAFARRKRGLSDETRAPKLQLKLPVSIRARVLAEGCARDRSARESGRIIGGARANRGGKVGDDKIKRKIEPTRSLSLYALSFSLSLRRLSTL